MVGAQSSAEDRKGNKKYNQVLRWSWFSGRTVNGHLDYVAKDPKRYALRISESTDTSEGEEVTGRASWRM